MGARQSLQDQIQDNIINIEMGISNLENQKKKALKRYEQSLKKARKYVREGDMQAATLHTNAATNDRNAYLNTMQTVNKMIQLVQHIQNSVYVGEISKEMSESVSLLSKLSDTLQVSTNTTNIDKTLDDINVKLKYFSETMDLSDAANKTNGVVSESKASAELLEKLIAEETLMPSNYDMEQNMIHI